jgi:hypothetical protein
MTRRRNELVCNLSVIVLGRQQISSFSIGAARETTMGWIYNTDCTYVLAAGPEAVATLIDVGG